MTSILYTLLACSIISVGALIHGAIGLGMGLFAAPLLLLIDPIFVPGPLLVSALVLTGLMTWREKDAIDYYGLGWGVVGRIVGTIIALTILSYVPQNLISVLSATLVLFAVFLSVLKLRTKLTIGSLVTAGSASGIMSTLSSVGGPPFALLYQYEKSAKLRATMSGFFILGTVISIVGLVLVGEFTFAHLKASLILLPGVLLGYYFSTSAIRILNPKYTRNAVLIVSALSSLAVIVQSLFK